MSYRIMVVVEDLDYDPDSRAVHLADAGWYGWIGGPGDRAPTKVEDYEEALAIAEELTVHFTTTSQRLEDQKSNRREVKMGATQAAGYAEAVREGAATLRQALSAHLSSNMYPPVPLFMLDTAVAAIEAMDDGDYERTIELPNGVAYKGEVTAPAYAVVDGLRLEAFITYEEEEG